ncbi:DUF4406 domain-containing protein [Treponema sp.]|uniref:DUF4406 domain-containing protein n=1 Tax=Treponema sp. TaxID=166 RepID=UPI003FD6C957
MKFDKNRIYTALNADELKKGDKVIVADTLAELRRAVEVSSIEDARKVEVIRKDREIYRFGVMSSTSDYCFGFNLAYLVERKNEKKKNIRSCKAEMTEEKRKKRVYISGQITGLDEGEYKALFKKAEDVLRQFGYEPVNPVTLDETENTKNWSWHDYMKRDIKIMCDCGYIYLLPNWRNSKGATFEYMVADALNIPCLNLQDIIEE